MEYSRPAVRGRSVFGDLVPFNQVWRTGANAAVQFNASTDFTFGGKAVKAGNYALFTIPNENTWTIILSNQTDLWGSGGYTEESDVARTEATPFQMPLQKAFHWF